MIALSKKLIETDDIATKREAYYVAKGWAEEVRFAEQTESDAVLDDVEAFFSINREQLGFVPEEKGGEVAGNLVVFDEDRDSGEELAIDCTKFGSGAYSIPISVEHLRFESDAKFVLAIETAGMFQRPGGINPVAPMIIRVWAPLAPTVVDFSAGAQEAAKAPRSHVVVEEPIRGVVGYGRRVS